MRKKMILNGTPVEVPAIVDNPVQGIYTQEEFDALTEEQKASGTYFVDDGATCSCGEVYSAEEQVVGRWIDGKPVYRRTLTFNAGSSSTTILPSKSHSIDVLINVYGYTEGEPTTARIPINSNVENSTMVWMAGNLDVKARATTSGMSGHKSVAVLEYTKTTDPEVSV